MDNLKDIHLNIETVTPETEGEGKPNDQKYNYRVENEVSGDAEKEPHIHEVVSDNRVRNENPGAEPAEQELAFEIETISP